jgi:predicted TIM-barrel fold metal-dependent hydrolase
MSLYDDIAGIAIIDDHAHPYCNGLYEQTVGMPAFADDHYLVPGPDTFKPLADLYLFAFDKLYGYRAGKLDEPARREMLRGMSEAEQNPEEIYARALDVANIGVSANIWYEPRPEFPAPRFRLLPPIDYLFYPLGDEGLPGARSHLGRANIRLFMAFQQRFRTEYGRPATAFEEYLDFAQDRIAAYAQAGCLGVKILSLYARPLTYCPASFDEARKVYEAGDNSEDSYCKLQNYLLRFALVQCVEKGLPVQVHATPGGANRTMAEATPLNLLPLIEDPDLRDLKWVILHGGWGVEADTGWLLRHYTNIYLDMSALAFFWLPSRFAEAIRYWLEMMPAMEGMASRMLYGSDNLGAAHQYVVAAEGARRAADIALSGMVEDGVIDRETAVDIATRFFRENAERVYRL